MRDSLHLSPILSRFTDDSVVRCTKICHWKSYTMEIYSPKLEIKFCHDPSLQEFVFFQSRAIVRPERHRVTVKNWLPEMKESRVQTWRYKIDFRTCKLNVKMSKEKEPTGTLSCRKILSSLHNGITKFNWWNLSVSSQPAGCSCNNIHFMQNFDFHRRDGGFSQWMIWAERRNYGNAGKM